MSADDKDGQGIDNATNTGAHSRTRLYYSLTLEDEEQEQGQEDR